MTINIQKCSNVTVNGTHKSRNCKAVYNITTGQIYASVVDAANALNVSQGAVSFALDDENIRTCKGMRLCFLSKMMEHLEEINQANIVRMEKVAAYDADEKRRNAIAAVEADVKKWEEKVDELQYELACAESNLNIAKRDLMELKNGRGI